MDAADWVTSVLATLALGVATWTALDSRQSAKRAVIASERSAAAAEALVPAPPPPVAWRLEWESGDGYNLRNMGSVAATGVTVEGLPAKSRKVTVRGREPLEVGAGEALKVIIGALMNLPRATSLRVTCAELPEPVVVPVVREQPSG